MDSLICVLLPVICIVLGPFFDFLSNLLSSDLSLAYIVQGHRYNIFEDLGCHPAIYNTLPAFFLVYMWPVVIGSISAVYCSKPSYFVDLHEYHSLLVVLSLRCLIRRQIRFNQLLSSNPSLTSGRYFRLMALALTDLVLTVPFGIYEIYSNAADGNVYPWKGWADTHYNFSRVESFPARLWRAQPAIAIPLELNRWIVPACAFVFFAYFGFAEEARKNYSAAYCVLTSRLACLRRSQPPDISK